MDIINLGAADNLPPVDWSAIVSKIDDGSPPPRNAHNSRSTWLATLNDDGSPHLTAVGAAWHDGTFWFQTGTGTRKYGNVVRDPRCSISVSVPDADVVIEGDAERVTDRDALQRLTEIWASGGWPAEVDASGTGITAPFNAPTLGPPPWHVFRVKPRSATVTLTVEPGGSTRFNF
jgi:PPOX class probable F420-dependent enzyme